MAQIYIERQTWKYAVGIKFNAKLSAFSVYCHGVYRCPLGMSILCLSVGDSEHLPMTSFEDYWIYRYICHNLLSILTNNHLPWQILEPLYTLCMTQNRMAVARVVVLATIKTTVILTTITTTTAAATTTIMLSTPSLISSLFLFWYYNCRSLH